MSLDFTMKKYEELCNAIVNLKYPIIRIKDYFKNSNYKKFIIIRHDVDKLPENALIMAQLEKKFGIKSTYYFRTIPEVFEHKIIQEISSLNHEIGYHFETLTQAEGNYEKALKIFEDELQKLRKITNISTISMHGSPLSKWNNNDLWEKYNFKEYGILGEPYLSINYHDIGYFTDTGRTWNNKGSVRDQINDSFDHDEKIKSTDDLIKFISTRKLKKLIILAHPQRWNIKKEKWLKELIGQNIKNIGKDLVLKRIKK